MIYQQQSTHMYPKSLQDRLRIAREIPPNVYIPSLPDDNALEDALEQQCNIQDSHVENYNNYKYDENDVSNNSNVVV